MSEIKLPHPVSNMLIGDDWEDVFTADQMKAAILEERERCAKICDFEFWRATQRDGSAAGVAAGNCADAIRSQ